MERVKHHWKRVPAPVRKPFILLLGIAVVLAGVAMLVGLALLATEFAIAAQLRDWSVSKVKSGIHCVKRKRQ